MGTSEYFEVTEREDGVIVMIPTQVIPESEVWLHTPEMKARLEQADAWFNEHPPAETDLDEFLVRIEAGRKSMDAP